MEDIVITSYKRQIKESTLKAEALKAGGYDIVVEELKIRGVKVDKLNNYFERISNYHTKEELMSLTLDELNEIAKDLHQQIIRLLISKAEIADVLARKCKIVALSKSPNGKIKDDDNYVRVGTNLAAEINKDGIAQGIVVCIRNYCIQKIYQADYREKMIEKEKELGIYDEEERIENKKKINQKAFSEKIDKNENNRNPKQKLLEEILNQTEIADIDIDFETAKNIYQNMVNERMKHLSEMK